MPDSKAVVRLRAIQSHMQNKAISSASTSSSSSPSPALKATDQQQRLDFSALPRLIPSEGNNTTETSLWYVVATAALLSFHQEPAVGELWKYINNLSALNEDTKIAIARRIRECCLKASVLVGFPRGINSLSSLQSSIETNSPDLLPALSKDVSLRAPVPLEEKLKRGKHFFSQIYSNHTDRILANMGKSSGGDLSDFAIRSVYGELMGEMRILNPMETVMMEFVCCLADNVAPQAKGCGCNLSRPTDPHTLMVYL
ncbi:hypothetical protein LOZ43_003941 [Ophidiomyces ophidiicola]|nr:hypothetical protein LOZ43_003941 [Ophidiomyces ophidiicola]